MASYESPTDYISHHLTNMKVTVSGMSVNIDTVVNSMLLGVITFGLLWLVARRVTAGVPGKLQAAVELRVRSSHRLPSPSSCGSW
jgi:F-type H+-transporting ATPase subunit a